MRLRLCQHKAAVASRKLDFLSHKLSQIHHKQLGLNLPSTALRTQSAGESIAESTSCPPLVLQLALVPLEPHPHRLTATPDDDKPCTCGAWCSWLAGTDQGAWAPISGISSLTDQCCCCMCCKCKFIAPDQWTGMWASRGVSNASI